MMYLCTATYIKLIELCHSYHPKFAYHDTLAWVIKWLCFIFALRAIDEFRQYDIFQTPLTDSESFIKNL